MDTDFYLLGHEAAEDRRLVRQAQDLAGETRWLFDQLDIPVGARAIDLGCGPRGVLDLLSTRVGSSGTVVGLERGEDTLARARAFVAEHGLHNVELIQGDARATGQPPGAFDLVHARLVLVNVPRPEEIVRPQGLSGPVV
ncbi:class I SAM-dependent methyltransferase [Stigmatella erecta]|uniref:Methyltransferase domain-containing protein n=1 Tax=Stigmatella erecta TaxID=83460 RepID=A0A1I0JK61_9BACT|nr:methyltransferase domain-containing protein [Stigmatella erecta]SEU10692.1 Methyltransferase domain-containing protein [Stigmatella erecta]